MLDRAALLPISFDVAALQADLARLSGTSWARHFNVTHYEGDWTGITLRSAPSTYGLYTGGEKNPAAFSATPALQASPYFQVVLSQFESPLEGVRLLRLAPGSIIREHSDDDLGEDRNEARIHIPITTNPSVEFYLAGERIEMNEGECWYLDLSQPHRVQNLGATERVHLVIDCQMNDWLLSLIRAAKPRPIQTAETSAMRFDRFRQYVVDDVSLQTQLRPFTEFAPFAEATVRLGQEHGYAFTTEDVRAVWRAGHNQAMSARLV